MKPFNPIEVSIVIAVRNEAKNIQPVGEMISKTLDASGIAYECLWIDDGSTDETPSFLKTLTIAEGKHWFLTHDKNFGKSAALITGFKHTNGKIIATMDGDGQNHPEDVIELIRVLKENNASMICGVRINRKDGWLRQVSSKVANFVRNRINGESIKDSGCPVKVFYRETLNNIPTFEGMHRFLPTLMKAYDGGTVLEHPVADYPRLHEKSKYGIRNRLWSGFCDAIGVRWLISRRIDPKLVNKK
jgi:dolichol-phosphate mannosyltransferase